jgi:phosphohistidine phosphatase SixA
VRDARASRNSHLTGERDCVHPGDDAGVRGQHGWARFRPRSLSSGGQVASPTLQYPEPISAPIRLIARVRFAPDSRRIVASRRTTRCATGDLPFPFASPRKGVSLSIGLPSGTCRMLNSKIPTVSKVLCLVALLSAGRALADDEQVWAALRQGGNIILLRHTHVDIQEGIGRLAPGNCAAEVNLSASGVEQAKRIGIAFRTHGIAVGEVLSSPYCRCIDTGKLAFGRASPVQYLVPPGVVSDSQAKLNDERVLKEILKHHGPSNLVMITHDLNISSIVLEPTVKMGEFFVLQPNGADVDTIGKIRMGDQ